MQTLRTGCSKAEPKISPHHRPLPGGVGRPKFKQLEMVTTFTYKHSLVRIDACKFWVIVVTDPQIQPQTHTQTGPIITIHCCS